MIYGIGRNYAAHAKELGNSVPKGNPIVFFKPDGAIVQSGKVKLPHFSTNVQFEVELAFKFGKNLEISEICVANDLTARDKQREAQDTKAPWGLAKGFKQSCGLGNWVKARGIDLSTLELRLTHNDRLAQHGFTKDMIFDVPTLTKYLIENFPVIPGDIVLTGTPEGVGTVRAGDLVKAEIVGVSEAQWIYE
jgi:2-keto-4-pentenoate hydratase/2-oxohepta-3-ene-1,7-dioic acid hydratase in catechol pathway